MKPLLLLLALLVFAAQSYAAELEVLERSELLNSTETGRLCMMAREFLEAQPKNIAIVLRFISQHEKLRADLESVGILERARRQLSKKRKLAPNADNDTVIAVLTQVFSEDDFKVRVLISSCFLSGLGSFFVNTKDIQIAQQRAKKLLRSVSDLALQVQDPVVTNALEELLGELK